MAIGGDINYPGPGWYLHLLFVQGKIRLYVGQTTSLRRRIVRQHCNEAYRSGNPSLHYKAWEQAEWDAWVVLGCGQITHHMTEAQKLYLNVGEMWCGLLFRSLLKRQLEKYLPPFAIGMLGPDQHLNIRSPLDQGTAQGNDILELAHSQDPLHRAYLLEAGRKGGRAFVSNVRERTRQKILAGGPFTVHKKTNGQLWIWFQYVEIHLGLSHNFPLASKSVRVHTEIVGEGRSHPQCWAKNARISDPARRLAFRIVCEMATSDHHWRNDTIQAIYRANNLVDWMEGRSDEYIASQPRRFIPENLESGVKKHGRYTSSLEL